VNAVYGSWGPSVPRARPALVNHPLFFYPFCGTKLQTLEVAKAAADGNGEGEEEPRQAG
jgi:hypothetical protein